MTTTVIQVREALADVITYDGVLGNLLTGKRVYAGKAIPQAKLNYIVLGQTTETGEGASYYNGQYGHLGTENIHCWARTKWTAQQIYARLVQLLDRQRITLLDHTVIKGRLEYVTDFEGEDENSWQVWARYRLLSVQGRLT